MALRKQLFVLATTSALVGFGNANAGCNDLTVKIQDPSEMEIIAAGCRHGEVLNQSPASASFSGNKGYGPDCRITIWHKKVGDQMDLDALTLLETQQNYCFLEAGSINVEVERGRKVGWQTEEGSYASSSHGTVTVY